MKNVIELGQDEIISAIGFYLDSRGASANVGTIKFAFDGKGEVLATLEGERAEPGEFDDDEDGGIGHETVHTATTQRETVDCFSKEAILEGVQCLWIQAIGITVVHPVEWPEDVRKDHFLTEMQLTAVSLWLGMKASVPKVSAAKLLDQIQERFGDREMAVAICQRDSLDFVSEKVLLQNTQAVWFEDYGVTITPLEDWPEEIIKKFEGKKPTEASTASDILGGGGDEPVDRGAALGKGLGRKGG